MTRTRFMISICVGTFVYIFLSVLAGQNGILAYNQLYEQKLKLTASVSNLQSINDELKSELEALKNDRSIIEAYARKLGLAYENEKIIKVTGLAFKQKDVYDTGTVIKIEDISYVPENVCKIAGLVSFAICFFILLVAGIRESRNREPHAVIIEGNNEITLPVEVVNEMPQM